uniref:MAK10-like protein n=1 Tax=Tanacetum cinerariifolium TaxID=118510 RepID=A0A6L2NE82_TANCI|nr:MAK10-like protein [Tanacetum cinerariifolium]
MENKNHVRTPGDYSRPSPEGYQNTIELPDGNNVVPLRSDTIRLVQNECLFHKPRSEDPNQHLKDFLKLVDSLDLDVANKEKTRLGTHAYECREMKMRRISLRNSLVGNGYMVNLLVKMTRMRYEVVLKVAAEMWTEDINHLYNNRGGIKEMMTNFDEFSILRLMDNVRSSLRMRVDYLEEGEMMIKGMRR